MTLLLLIVIYIAFIGLGIPDSLFGAAWPAIYSEFDLPISSANLITLIISGGTVLSSFFSARIINRFGTAAVTFASTLFTAVALLGFSLSGSLLWLCISAVPLGIGAGSIDSALNNYVALHYKATHMNFLHCFYGIGVSLSPYLMSLALSDNSDWHRGYRVAFFIQLGITTVTLISLPLWKKAHGAGTADGSGDDIKPHTLTILELVKIPGIKADWLMFICSCAIEFTCGTWGSTYLVNAKGASPESAARVITFYYVGIAVGRFLSGLAASKLKSRTIIHIGQAVVLAAIIVLLLPLPIAFSCVGLFMVGLGNGPVFPNLTHLTPKSFGAENSQSVIGSQLAMSYIGVTILPMLFGVLAQYISAAIMPLFLLAIYVIFIFATVFLNRTLKKEGRY